MDLSPVNDDSVGHRQTEPSAMSDHQTVPQSFCNEGPHTHRPVSPLSSCVSMKSNWSMGEPPTFSNGADQHYIKPQTHRPVYPLSSCVSMKSDWSMGEPPTFSNGADQHYIPYTHSPVSPLSSCVSMKSDWSIDQHPTFSNGEDLHYINGFPLNQVQSRCGVCKQELEEQITTTCGHSFCRQCIIRYGSQSGLLQSGDYNCPQCNKRSRTRLPQHLQDDHSAVKRTKLPDEHVRKRTLMAHKACMKRRFESICEGIVRPGTQTLLNKIYTELYITEGESEGVNKEHEVWQVESASRPQTTEDTAINCNDIFKPLTGEERHIRTVMTKGIAGIGKTVSVQKFILDWAEEKANQDVDFMFVLPFRELNLVRHDQYSLHRLLFDFHPELRELQDGEYKGCHIVFIFDGLDESRLPLNFQGNQKLSDVTQTSSVDVLITSLIQKTLLLLPVFCWISATVLQQILEQDDGMKPPKTLTEMFIHFLLIQTTRKNQKYHNKREADGQRLQESHKHVILKLAELAFRHLENGNLMFYEEDLRECGIDLSEATVYSGMCTEIFREECMFHHKKVYCFVHLSIQEFLAALHLFASYLSKNIEALKPFLSRKSRSLPDVDMPLDVLLKNAVNKALESKNGHLDLFVRFLHGISLVSNQRLLLGLLTHTNSSPESVKKIIKNLKVMQRPNISPERCINLFLCLVEMHDSSVHEEIQAFLKGKKGCVKQLSLVHCSALAHVLLMADEVLDEFDLKKYKTSAEGRRRLVPAVRCCRKALLAGCNLTEASCKTVASALQSVNSPLRDLDLSRNDLQKSGEKLLSALQSPNCKLETLRLVGCHLTVKSCEIVSSALQSSVSLINLDLSNNDLKDSGVEFLSVGLSDPHCKLQTLRLSDCLITHKGCSFLALALKSNPSYLKELDLSYNHPGDSGIRELTDRLNDPNCKLETFRFDHGGEYRMRSGLRKYVCDLTLDINTVHSCLSLSEENRKVTCVYEDQSYPENPERFKLCPQVLCRESLSGRHYWETECSGDDVTVAVTYKSIERKGGRNDSVFGFNNKSWSLSCSNNSYTVSHNNKHTDIPVPSPHSRRVGVYLDCPAGTLSFYSVSSDTLTHLYTFHSTFTEPLYPGFRVWRNSSLSLCQIT